MPNPIVTLTVLAALASSATAQETWSMRTPRHGASAGETTVTVAFPEPVTNAPLSFGIPVGQARSPDHLVLLNERGRPLPADFFPLGDWDSQPAHWALVSCVVSAGKTRRAKPFTIRWGEKARVNGQQVECEIENERARVNNGVFEIVLEPSGVRSLTVRGRKSSFDMWRPAIILDRGMERFPVDGELQLLYDGHFRKTLRFTSRISLAVELQQEFDIHAGSPFVRCRARFINRTVEDVPVDGIVPLAVDLADVEVDVGLDIDVMHGKGFFVRQRAFDWSAGLSRGGFGGGYAGAEDNLGEWVAAEVKPGVRLMWVFPYFQEMAPADYDSESELLLRDGILKLQHYMSCGGPGPDIRLRETMARTFEYWLVVDPKPGTEGRLAAAVKAMPYVIHDREHLTEMGVFQEKTVSSLFDDDLLEAALYFPRARVPRPEYVRCGRGTDPGPDKSGEGAYEVDLHAGGMLFGEVFQYFVPEPSEGDIRFYTEELGIGREHVITGGRYAYRNGDIPLALFQAYLRTGDQRLAEFARIHTQLFADYAVSHAPESEGVGHYYCDWYGNPYVYERFEGLLLGYLATGETWWFESAKAMADFCARAWKDGHPRDASINGSLGGVQTRSAYIAKMLMMMADVTGDDRYSETALRLAEWAMEWQEPEGWWTMHPGTGRDFRCTPIFSGYICQGLWSLYRRTDESRLRQCLLRAADWYMEQQEDARGSNPGTFPNSYWYGEHIKATDPIRGNYATTQHAANILLQAYRATGDLRYFYGANAAWVGVLNHQTPEGGIPLENSRTNSVWSHVMIESLADFGATAEEGGLPIVLSSRTGVPGTSFMGRGATFQDGVFACELKYRNSRPVPVRVFVPDPVIGVSVDGEPSRFVYDRKRRTAEVELARSEEFVVARLHVFLR